MPTGGDFRISSGDSERRGGEEGIRPSFYETPRFPAIPVGDADSRVALSCNALQPIFAGAARKNQAVNSHLVGRSSSYRSSAVRPSQCG
jgi:hypothetical protein